VLFVTTRVDPSSGGGGGDTGGGGVYAVTGLGVKGAAYDGKLQVYV